PGITRQVPQFDPAGVPPFVFSLDGVSWKVSTVLFVNRDPGVWFAGFGAVFFIAGVMLVFFVPHEQVWAVLEPEGGRLRLKVAMRRNGRAVEVPGELLERVTAAGGGR
ncbi:MAG TPA: cytochrome c biogenesis protein ResB, partial [Deltaproteobacteria bacterium]|nr:cytochrome c biogenesis protein ResB [Deltaproteobacteria bacterium]